MFLRLLFFLFCATHGILLAQIPAQIDSIEFQKNQWAGSVLLASNGIGGSMFYGRQKKAQRSTCFELEFFSIRALNQSKIVNSNYKDSRGYFFGKINSLYAVCFSVGGQHRIFEKDVYQGIEIDGIWSVGLNLGYLKPTFVKIREPYPGGLGYEVPVDVRYDPTIHHSENIYGRSVFSKGLKTGEFIVGSQIKAGILFNLSNFGKSISGIELGMKADVFFQPVNLMYNSSQPRVMSACYAKCRLGIKR
jgi:hypothetical protein